MLVKLHVAIYVEKFIITIFLKVLVKLHVEIYVEKFFIINFLKGVGESNM